MHPNHSPKPNRASGGMPSKPLWKASIKQAIESTSPKKHFESCVENEIRFENNRVGQWHTTVQVQFKVPDGMGKEKWTMEFR